MLAAQEEAINNMRRWVSRALHRHLARAWAQWQQSAGKTTTGSAATNKPPPPAASGAAGNPERRKTRRYSAPSGEDMAAKIAASAEDRVKAEEHRTEVEALKQRIAETESAAASEAKAASEARAQAATVMAAIDHRKLKLKSIGIYDGPVGVTVGVNKAGYITVSNGLGRVNLQSPVHQINPRSAIACGCVLHLSSSRFYRVVGRPPGKGSFVETWFT